MGVYFNGLCFWFSKSVGYGISTCGVRLVHQVSDLYPYAGNLHHQEDNEAIFKACGEALWCIDRHCK